MMVELGLSIELNIWLPLNFSTQFKPLKRLAVINLNPVQEKPKT